MLKKSQIFSFILTFAITFVIGFFLWDAIVLKGMISKQIFVGSITVPKTEVREIIQQDFVAQVEPEQVLENEVLPSYPEEPVIPTQDILDDIQEKLDIIQQKVNQLIAEQNKKEPEKQLEQELVKVEDEKQQEDSAPVVVNSNGSSSGGSVAINYPIILISEALVSPIEQRFIELFNPNDFEVDLTGWYLQRKDANDADYGTFVSHTNFERKIIPANGYFLISKEDVSADLQASLTLTSNNFLALKSPNREIKSEANWSEIQDGATWCYDFGLCFSTPKTPNTAYAPPEIIPEPTPPPSEPDPEPTPEPEIPLEDTTPPTIISYTLNGSSQDTSFNPQNQEKIDIVVTASEPVDWLSAKIYKADDVSVYKNKLPGGDGSNSTTFNWDGSLSKPDVQLADGIYLIKVHIRDLAGNDVDDIILTPYGIIVAQ